MQSIAFEIGWRNGSATTRAIAAAAVVALFATFSFAVSEQPYWIAQVRTQVAARDFSAAAKTVDQRLQAAPGDLEARGWRARILAWTGHWAEAETEYRSILLQAPADMDVLLGLSDVLFWQGKLKESSAVIERARELEPSNPEVDTRRSQLEAAFRAQLHAAAEEKSPQSPSKATQEQLAPDLYRYSVTVGSETDLFSFTSPVQAQSATFNLKWNPRWQSAFSGTSYRRLDQTATEISSSMTFRVTGHDAVTFTYGQGNRQQIAPVRQMSFEYDRGLQSHFGPVKGLELTTHSAEIWFDASQVVVLGGTAIIYLPRDWICSFTANEARTAFVGIGNSWSPAASTKVSFPSWSRLRLDAGFGVGAENYSNIDQIGRVSARAYMGGAHYRVNHLQDFSVFLVYQQRSRAQTQTSIGGGYGFHF